MFGTPYFTDSKPITRLPMTEVDSFKAQVNPLRAEIGALCEKILSLKKSLLLTTKEEVAGANKGEVAANIMLAYRHAEDARLRLGKAIQAADGGVSVYDKEAA